MSHNSKPVTPCPPCCNRRLLARPPQRLTLAMMATWNRIASSQLTTTPRAAHAAFDASAAQRVQRLFAVGHARKAMETLTSVTSLADLDDDDERSLLRRLHPTADCPLPECPAEAPAPEVDPVWLADAMRASDTLEQPLGRQAGGCNLLSVLADDELCVQPMAYLVSQIVSNRLPATVRTLLTTSFLVSIKKDTTGAGRRPVAIGDMFCRLAGRYAASLVLRDVQRAVAPHQYGAGLSDGCTQVVHSVQHLVDDSICAASCRGTQRPMPVLAQDGLWPASALICRMPTIAYPGAAMLRCCVRQS